MHQKFFGKDIICWSDLFCRKNDTKAKKIYLSKYPERRQPGGAWYCWGQEEQTSRLKQRVIQSVIETLRHHFAIFRKIFESTTNLLRERNYGKDTLQNRVSSEEFPYRCISNLGPVRSSSRSLDINTSWFFCMGSSQ